MTGKQRWLPFITGMLTGLVLAVVLIVTVSVVGTNQTWLIRVNTHSVTEKMEETASIMVADLMPKYIEAMKEDVPDLVAQGVKNQFDDAKLHFGGQQFAMPPEFIENMENNYRDSLTQAIYDLLETLPMDQLSQEISAEFVNIVNNSIYAQYNSRNFEVGLLRDRVTIPIYLELISQPNGINFHVSRYEDSRR